MEINNSFGIVTQNDGTLGFANVNDFNRLANVSISGTAGSSTMVKYIYNNISSNNGFSLGFTLNGATSNGTIDIGATSIINGVYATLFPTVTAVNGNFNSITNSSFIVLGSAGSTLEVIFPIPSIISLQITITAQTNQTINLKVYGSTNSTISR